MAGDGPERSPGPSEAPKIALDGQWEFVLRVWALAQVGPLRVAAANQHDVPIPDANSQLVHINTSGKPQFVEIRLINGQPAPVFFVGSQQNVNVEQAQPWNPATGEVFRAITYPSDRLFIKQQGPAPTRVIVSEVNL
jgi:hypothetical protein